jgi:hypothetical protein
VFSKKEQLTVTVTLLQDKKKIKPNSGLARQLIPLLVTSYFWEKVGKSSPR